MNPPQKVRIDDVCRILEIPVSSYGLDEHMSKEKAEKALQDFKDLVKKQHRVLAKKYHPDKTGGDDEKIKEINATIDLVMKLEITRVQQPRPQNVHFHFSSNPFGGFTDDSTTSNETFAGFKFYRH